MIEKFNFYDVYGYFLPGAALIAILWLPFGFVAHIWPTSDWSGALGLAALAYLCGHLLQTYGATALKSRVAPNNRFPSDAALDPGTLPDPLRDKISEVMKKKFGLDLGIGQACSKDTDEVRNHAFFLARSALVKDQSNSYAEQYQGMYALNRGLMIAFGWGFSYWAGWSASLYRDHCVPLIMRLVLTISLLCLICAAAWTVRAKGWHTGQRASLFALLPLTVFATGYLLGKQYPVTATQSRTLGVLSAAALVASLRFFGAYKAFANHFAIGVWRDFLALSVIRTDEQYKRK